MLAVGCFNFLISFHFFRSSSEGSRSGDQSPRRKVGVSFAYVRGIGAKSTSIELLFPSLKTPLFPVSGARAPDFLDEYKTQALAKILPGCACAREFREKRNNCSRLLA